MSGPAASVARGLPPAAGPLYIRPALCASAGQGQAAPSLYCVLCRGKASCLGPRRRGRLPPPRDPWHCRHCTEKRGRRTETRCCRSSCSGCSCCATHSARCLDCCSTSRHATRGVSSACPRVKGASARYAIPETFLRQPPSSRPISATISATWRYWRRVMSSRSWHRRR